MSNWEPENFEKFYSIFFDFNVELFRKVKADITQYPVRILDMACGTGTSTRAISKVFTESSILGIDSDHRLIEHASLLFTPHNVTYKELNANDYKMLGAQFDLIVIKSALHLFGNSFDTMKLIDILNKGGSLCLIEKTEFSMTTYPLPNEALAEHYQQVKQNKGKSLIFSELSSDEFDLRTLSFGTKVQVPKEYYMNAISNGQMSCLWGVSEKNISNWILNNSIANEFVNLFEEYDISLIRRKNW